jgi:hypothetical protein
MKISVQIYSSLCLITPLVLSLILNSNYINLANGDSVSLLPLSSGNDTLDRNLPTFYDCIDDAVKKSKNEQKDPYFKSEPTRNEVVQCYDKVIAEGTSLNNERK